MGDSDDEFDRKKGRDKFRRERNDYDRRNSDDHRRDNWDNRRPMRGGQRGWRGGSRGFRGGSQPMRSREMWNNRGGSGGRRDMYSRPFDDRRRDRFSPGRYDNPHPAKRMRRDWDEGGYPGMYENPFPVRDGPPGPGPGGWNHRPMEVRDGPPERFGERPEAGDADYPTQPPMMTFKQFLNKQDDTISQEDAIKLFADYKLDFKKQQINEFFVAHKEEEWFKSKYHPEEFEKRQKEQKVALFNRRKAFESLTERGFLEGVLVEDANTPALVKILDATVILLEGGTDLDLTILDQPQEDYSADRLRKDSETQPQPKPEEQPATENGEDGEITEPDKAAEKADSESCEKKEAPVVDPKDLSLEITPEQEELKKAAMEYQKQQQEAAEAAKAAKRKKKSMRKKSDYSYETDSESESDSDSDPEPAPPGLEINETPPAAPEQSVANTEEGEEVKPKTEEKPVEPMDESGDNKKEIKEDETADKVESGEIKEKSEEDQEDSNQPPKPRPLHRTNSIFLRQLAPTITKQEVEAMCRRFQGFKRVAIQDPLPERRFFRRGWVTFSQECNIKEVCWSLSNIRLRDCELGAIVNRDLKIRVRPANGLTVHKQVMRNDIKIAAKIIQNLDNKWALWSDEGEEKKDTEKSPEFGFVSKNPVLKNITDFLVDEGSFEEDELIGANEEDKKEDEQELKIDRDPALCQALDKMILYLRIVFSIDYYTTNEYPNEDEMPHRCGIMHARGEPPGPTAKLTQADVTQYLQTFEKKIKPFMDVNNKLTDTECMQLGKKDADVEVEKFVQSNTQELARDKWLCPISGKKFKGPEFVRKHIFNKHAEKVEEVKKEVKYFNNYLQDPKRPTLPEHPSSRPKPPPSQPPPNQQGAGRGDGFNNYNNGGPGGGYNQRPGYGGGPGYNNSPFPVRDRPPPEAFRRNTYGIPRAGRRSDPRQLVQYTDLDAPDDDIF